MCDAHAFDSARHVRSVQRTAHAPLLLSVAKSGARGTVCLSHLHLPHATPSHPLRHDLNVCRCMPKRWWKSSARICKRFASTCSLSRSQHLPKRHRSVQHQPRPQLHRPNRAPNSLTAGLYCSFPVPTRECLRCSAIAQAIQKQIAERVAAIKAAGIMRCVQVCLWLSVAVRLTDGVVPALSVILVGER